MTKGGDVIAYQVENEYAAHSTSADQYMADLERQAAADGIDVPFTFNQCCGAQTYTSGLGAVNISGTDNYSTSGLASGPHTLTVTVTGTKDAAASADTVVIDAVNVPTAAELAGYFPQVPQSGTITLDGRDSRLLVAHDDFGGQHLLYSTSELMTEGTIGARTARPQDTAVLYDPAGTDGETVLRYASRPAVNVLSGTVQSTWDPASGALRLDYVHDGLAKVAITGGGTTPLLLLIADTDTAEDFWPESTADGAVLVEGGYLVRTASVTGGTLELTGDTAKAGSLAVWAPATVRSVTWNGQVRRGDLPCKIPCAGS